jgi:hypothetical protein
MTSSKRPKRNYAGLGEGLSGEAAAEKFCVQKANGEKPTSADSAECVVSEISTLTLKKMAAGTNMHLFIVPVPSASASSSRSGSLRDALGRRRRNELNSLPFHVPVERVTCDIADHSHALPALNSRTEGAAESTPAPASLLLRSRTSGRASVNLRGGWVRGGGG